LLTRHKKPVDNTSFFDFRVFVTKEEKQTKTSKEKRKNKKQTNVINKM